MILKALYDYYHRSGDLPPMGFEKVAITFIIVIDEKGNFLRIDDTRDGKSPKSYIVPRGVGRSSAISPNLLWDNGEYVLGIPKVEKDEKKKAKAAEKAQDKMKAFAARCSEVAKTLPSEKQIQAIDHFYKNKQYEKATEMSNWHDVEKSGTANFSFQIIHSLDIVAELDCVKEYLSTIKKDENTDTAICLVTGEKGIPVRLTTRTPILGSQATASLVSFQKSSGYDSYGKEQCFNAPISEKAEATYVASLQKLLAKDSRNKCVIGNRTFIFWASNVKEASTQVENGLFALFSRNDNDDPNKNLAKVRQIFKSIWSGTTPSTSDDRFYMLGLAPNSARLAVVYWNECSIKEFTGAMIRHFDDMEIVDGRKEPKPYAGIYSMLSAVTLGGKSSDVQPNLPEAVLKSVVQGYPYPFTLFSACIRRIKAELGEKTCFSITRMAIIKAYLNRLINNDKKISIMLDKENTNAGYLCGRLFAVIDKIQNDTYQINSIRERYMNAASSTPSTVFGTILNLSSHHEEKLSAGAKVMYEKIKQEIIDKFSADGFPTHLNLQDQGRFFVGFYQQRQDLFTKKTEKEENK